MGRIVVSENVSLDGIMQDPTGDEGFKFGGWFDQMPDVVRAEWVKVEYQEALETAAWLVGRGTYSWFAERWADRPGEWADRLRSVPKYVVSSTLDDPTEWTNSTVLRGDVIEQVTKLKQAVDGDILVYGSGPLVQMLMEHDLVDELRLRKQPLVWPPTHRTDRSARAADIGHIDNASRYHGIRAPILPRQGHRGSMGAETIAPL